MEDFRSIISPGEEIAQIEFKIHYPPEQLFYKRYMIKGFLAALKDEIQIKIDDDPEGILGVIIICTNLSMEHLYDLAIMEIEFSALEKGRLFFIPRSFSIRSTKGVNYKVKAPAIQSRITDRSFLLCDLNKDNIVDRMDFGLFMNSYGSKQGDSNFDERNDFNQDMRIDMLDLLTIAKEMGKFL